MKKVFKFNDFNSDESFDISDDTKIFLDDVLFERGFISRVKISKHTSSRGEYIFINIYMGNVQIATVVTESDYVFEMRDREFPNFIIRKAEQYDYA